MIYCLDTDIIIEHFRGNEGIKERIQNLAGDDKLGLIWLTIYEFFKGIFVSGKLGEEKFLQDLVETCLILEPSYEAAKIDDLAKSQNWEGKVKSSICKARKT